MRFASDWLPRSAQAASASRAAPRPSLLGADSSAVSHIARRTPEQHGYDVVDAASPNAALDLAAGLTGGRVCVLHRVAAFLQNPFTPLALATRVREVLDL